MNPLLASAAALLLAAPTGAQSADPFQPEVHVEYGRCVLVQRGSRGELLLPQSKETVSGIAYLLVGAGARASVTWRGQSSLLLHGPAEIEWAPAEPPLGAHELTWSVLRLGEIDVEVRRGSPELKLPGGWRTRLGEGAFYVSGNGRDACDLEVRAGETLALRPELRGGRVRPPIDVEAGSRVRLSDRHIAVSRPDTTANADEWGRVSWPWRSRAAEPTTVAGLEPQAELQRGHQSVPVEPSTPKVTFEPAPPAPRSHETVDLEVHPSLPFFLDPEDEDDLRAANTPPVEPPPAKQLVVERTSNTPTPPKPVRIDPPRTEIEDEPGSPPTGASSTPPAPRAPNRVGPSASGSTPGSASQWKSSPGTVPSPPVVRIDPPEQKPAPSSPQVVEARPAPPAEVRPVEPRPTQPEPRVARRPEPKPAPTPRPATSFVASQWQSRSFGELEPVGDCAVERSDALRTTRLGSDRWRVALSARATGPVWFFGRDEDIELQPGASVTVGADGFLQSTQGLTRSVDAPAGRPLFGKLK